MADYKVKKAANPINATVEVPGSKSITNRALLISALSDGRSFLKKVLFSDDSRVFIKALQDLGFLVEADESTEAATVTGQSKFVSASSGDIYVGSAGTAARFLTALLALSDGRFTIDASEQMRKRPMLPLFEALSRMGADFTFAEKEGFLPVTVKGAFCDENELLTDTAVVDSDSSTQFLSALLMMAPVIANRTGKPFRVQATGNRAQGSYVKMTLKVMKDFGVSAEFDRDNQMFSAAPGLTYKSREYEIEPDVSAASYFYAAAAVTGGEIIVNGVHPDSCQGDIRFLDVLKQMGCSLEDTAGGLKLTGPNGGKLRGISIDMKDFSDQTMTLAAIAPFCDSPVEITGIGHIRRQESDRISAIASELGRMGIDVEESEASLKIYPGTPAPAEIETYNDHRIAMAFSLVGLRTDGIVIKDYECCKKTFEKYFEVFDTLTHS